MLVQRLVTLCFRNETLIPVLLGLVSSNCLMLLPCLLHGDCFPPWSECCLCATSGQGKLPEIRYKRSWRGMSEHGGQRKCALIGLSASASEVEPGLRRAAFTHFSCMQNFPPQCEKLLLLLYLLGELHRSSTHSLCIISSISLSSLYGLVINLWDTRLKTMGLWKG